MKKIESLQSDFYKEVNAILPNLFNKVNTLQLVKKSARMVATISFKDVTGRSRTEDVVIDTINSFSTTQARYLAEMFRQRLIENYPGFVDFDSVEEAVAAAIQGEDENLTYTYDGVEIGLYENYLGERGIVWCEGEVVDHIPFKEDELIDDESDAIQRIADQINLDAFNIVPED